MPSTDPTTGWPIPDDGDPLADGAAAIRALAAAIGQTMAAGDVYAYWGTADVTPTLRRCRFAFYSYLSPANSGNREVDISMFGFTDVPRTFLTPLANNASGAVVLANRAIGDNTPDLLTFQLVDARNGDRITSDTSVHIALFGPVD